MAEQHVATPPMEHSSESSKLAAVADFLAHKQRRKNDDATRYYLSGSDGNERVELTEELFDVLKRAAEALRRGQSVSLLRRDQEITTQQAADLLGLSRPTIVKLIDDGALEANIPGAVRRKLRLSDVLAYKERLHADRSAFIAESSDEYTDIDEDDIAQALSEIRGER